MKKAQISIEFIIVFSFILVVFLFLFALIAQQRAVTANSQTFSQLQLIAQGIALQLGRAAQAGNGYSASLPISTSLGVTQYNLSITKSGLVIVTSLVSNQALRATAYSNVQSVMSSAQFLSPLSTAVYNLPIANGTVYVQNSYGNICVDYQCPLTSNQVSSISLASQNVHAAYFDGTLAGTSVLSGSDVAATQSTHGTGFSVSAWVYLTDNSTGRGITQGDSYVFRVDSPGESSRLSWFVYINSAIEPRLSSTKPLKLNRWYYVVGTYNSTSGYMGLYINGLLNSTETRAGSPTLGYCSCFNIGVGSSNDWAGDIANMQIYDFGLSANQVTGMYYNGIAASPINTTYLTGWWPLNGNPNDYSGQGDNLASSGVLYPAVSQLFATAKNPLGQAVNNVLVGFETTLGNFTNGFGAPAASVGVYTSNGYATTFLNQQGNNGQAVVKAVAYNGNQTLTSLMNAWYPLNLDQGSNALDTSGNGNHGYFVNQPGWSAPNYFAQFSGPQTSGLSYSPFGVPAQTNYVEQSTGFTFMDSAAQAFTASIWVYPNATGGQAANGIIMDELGSQSPNVGWHDSWLELVNGKVYMRIWASGCYYLGSISTNKWTNIVMTYNGAVLTGYINSAPTNSVTYTRQVPGGGATAMFYPLGLSDVTNCGSGLSYSGGMANFQFYNTALSANQVNQVFSSGMAGQPLSSQGVQLWWPLDGDSLDYSGNSNNGVEYGAISSGSVAATVPQQLVSNGNYSRVLTASFNGVSSYMNVGNVVAINQFSNWTVSFWMNSTNAGAYHNPFDADFTPSANNAGPRFEQGGAAGSNSLNLIVGTGPASYNVYTYSNAIAPNVWYHVIAAKSGNTITGYLNGVQVFNQQNTLWPSGFTNLTIGRGFANSANRWFYGNLSNVEVYNQTLSPQQATALFQEGIGGTPLAGTKLAGWWPLSGNGKDQGANGYNANTVSNVVYKNSYNYVPALLTELNNSGVGFNGQSYVLLPGSAAILGSSDRTVSVWIKTASTWGTAGSVIFSWGEESAGNWYGVSYPGSTNRFDYADWAVGDHLSAPLQTNTWYNLVTTLGSGGTVMNLYINGVQDPNFPITSPAFNTLGGSVFISARNDLCTCANLPAGSQVADMQIYKNVLTANQIMQLYDGGLPPTASVTVPLSWYP